MTEPPREWKKATEKLRYLSHYDKRSERRCKYGSKSKAKLETVQPLYLEDGDSGQAVCSKQENKISGCEKQIDVFETQQGSKNQAAE